MIKGKQKEVKTTEEKYLYRKKDVRTKWFFGCALGLAHRARIFKRLWSPGIDSKE
jgi:hypothetical protein